MSTTPTASYLERWRALCYLAIAWISLGEWRAYDRLVFRDAEQYGFVLNNIQGVLEGRPVSKSWQQRFLPTEMVAALDGLTGDRLSSLKWFSGLMLFAASALLYHLLRRKGAGARDSLVAVVCFGLVRLLLTYRLEYPWDAVDILLFMTFGYWAATQRSIVSFVPMLCVGLFNHETILYVPLWYLLAPLVRRDAFRAGKWQLLTAGVLALGLGAAIIALREAYYVGEPNWPGQTFEKLTPVISNHLHLEHNLRQLLVRNWRSSNAFVSMALLPIIVCCVRGLRHARERRQGAWTLILIATVLCFGYVCEVRHYLLLVAFWFTFAWPVPAQQTKAQPLTRVTV